MKINARTNEHIADIVVVIIREVMQVTLHIIQI